MLGYLSADIRELTQPRRRRQQGRHKFAYLIVKNDKIWLQKYARIFVLGHYLFLEAHSFPQALLLDWLFDCYSVNGPLELFLKINILGARLTPRVTVGNMKAPNCEFLVPSDSCVSLQVVQKKRPQTADETNAIPDSKPRRALPDLSHTRGKIRLHFDLQPPSTKSSISKSAVISDKVCTMHEPKEQNPAFHSSRRGAIKKGGDEKSGYARESKNFVFSVLIAKTNFALTLLLGVRDKVIGGLRLHYMEKSCPGQEDRHLS